MLLCFILIYFQLKTCNVIHGEGWLCFILGVVNEMNIFFVWSRFVLVVGALLWLFCFGGANEMNSSVLKPRKFGIGAHLVFYFYLLFIIIFLCVCGE